MKTFFKIYSIIFLSLIFFSCEKETVIKYVTSVPPKSADKLLFSSDPLVFITGETTQKKIVLTTPDSSLEYSVLQVPDWVIYHREKGFVYGLHDFEVWIDTFRVFPYGITRDSIEFYTIYGKSYLEIQFINGKGEQIVVEDTIEIGEITNNTDFSFFNRTQDSIYYTLSNNSGLTINPASGLIQSYESKMVNVSLDRSQLTQDTTYFTFDINYNNTKKTIVLRVLSFFENKIHLDGNVVDAVYESKSKLLYYLNNKPYELVKFDPETEQFQSLSLNYDPLCLSISSSGNYAAIGNDGNATLINLSNFSAIRTFNTGTLPSDIVLKDSSFVYVFPKLGTHVRVQCINLLNNDSISKSTGNSISDDSKAVLHPTQDAIYIADNGVSPSDIDKLDITSGTAHLLYDSPYHGTYSMAGNLWIAKDGDRLITRGQTVLTTTTSQSTDLVYGGSVQLNIPQNLMNGRPDSYFLLQSLDEDVANDELVMAYFDRSTSPYVINQVYTYKASNLQYLKSYDLESFIVPNTASGKYDHYKADPIFTFYTGYNDEILVLTKGSGSGLTNPWGLELINP